MKHARKDYDRIQDPALFNRNLLPTSQSTPIGEEEPVLLFRAKDKYFLDILFEYIDLLSSKEMNANKQKMIDMLQEHAELARDWQIINGCKTPDIP